MITTVFAGVTAIGAKLKCGGLLGEIRKYLVAAFVAGVSFAVLADGAPIYRVAQEAAGKADGSSWNDAMTLDNGIAAVAAGGELWLKSGIYALAANVPTLTASGEVVVRGGFAGTETLPEERAAGVKTTIDGQHLYTTFTVTCNKSVTLERIILTHSLKNGLYKTGSSTFTARDCDFNENGWQSTETVDGRGAYVTKGNNYFTNCTFKLNFGLVQSNYGSSGLHAYQATRVYIDNCLFERNGYAGVGRWASRSTLIAEESPITMRHTVFRGNRATVDQNSAVIRLDKRGDNSVISHCQFVANEECGSGGGGIFSIAYLNGAWNGHTHHIDFDNCTFAYNVSRVSSGATALSITHGIVTVKNCIFYGNLAGSGSTSGVDISVTGTDGNCTVSHCLFGGDKEHASDHYKAVNGTLTPEEGIIFGDPRFVSSLDDFRPLLTNPETTFPKSGDASPALVSFLQDDEQFAKIKALDVHLLSSRGYYTNDGVLHENEGDVASTAIDKGDGDVGDEPEPNGGIRNLGCYGGTAEASMTPEAAAPAVDSVAVTFEGEYSQPTVTFTLGGTGAYSADAVISISTNGTDWCYVSDPISGLEKGTTKSVLVPEYYLAGGKIVAKVSILFGSVSAEGASSETEITGALPPWAGKGGDAAKIIHVRPGATCRKDGTSWSDAFVTLDDAFAAVTADRNEIWVAGSFTWTGARASFTFAKAVAIRGGFAGTENAASEREDGALTVIDGHEQANGLTFANSAAVSIERFRFTNGKARGLDRTSSAGDLTVSNCEFVANGHYSDDGPNTGSAQGSGACFVGSGSSRLALVNCLFEENTKTNNGSNPITWPACGCGAGAYVSGFARATLEDCRFVRNGICNDAKGFRGAGTRALHIAGTPVTLVGCEFRGNGGNTWQGCGPIVNLSGACGGSAFTNCLWAGNNEGNGTDAGQGNAALAVSLDTVDAPVDLVNCTFAYNVADATEKPAGLHVVKGAAKVRNCIFWGNAVGDLAKVGADIHTATNGDASAEVAYTLFGGEGENWASGSNELANCTFGDPRFVTTLTDFTNTASKVTAGVPGRTALPSIKPASLVAASVFDVHARKRSPAIDAGDPESDYKNEPSPNGHRVNLGFYGNTPWAMTSKLGLLLLVQ